MKCEFCGVDNNERARYCGGCGLSLHERCPNPMCRAGVLAQQKFCSTCGSPLATLQGSLANVQTSKHVADLILKAGERKIVTLLVADVADSTALIGGLDAEEADRILGPTLERMIKAVERYEGTIAWTAGDGIMGIFGAPIAHEDHAVRACHAALDMQEAMRSLAAEVRRDFGRLLQVRIGLNSGPVIAKLLVQGDDVTVDYRAVGLTTHVAARLQSLAAPGAILLSRDTFALAKGFVRVGPFEQLAVKSIPAGVEVCELNGINTRMRIRARAARGLSKFVGRKDEMEMLSRAAVLAQSGHGQVVALVGEAGVGKSRVFWEFTHSPAMRDWLVLDAGSVSYGKATSYLPIVDLLTRYFEIKGRDDERRVREKISGKLFALGEKKLLAQMPLFVGTLGWGDNDDTWKSLTPAERQQELFSALKNLLIRESQEQPLCAVFEDLHWVDDETQSFLDMLVESIPAAKVLLLVNFRPEEYKIRWTAKSCYSQARIDPLPAASVDELLGALLGPAPELASTKKLLVSVTQGNPLFLEEYVRSLIESGALAGRPGQWRPTGPLPAVAVPQSIEAILAARIDRLPPELKEIIQCAAVIGNDVPRALLEALAALPQEKIERGVRELQAAEFLYEKTLFPETEYTFKHSITREVAYASLLKERRKRLHADVATALVAAGRLEEHVERIAEHAQEGQLWPIALEYLQRAGEKAFGLYANLEATKCFERALVALEHLPKNRAHLEQAVDLRFELRNALIALGRLDTIHKHLVDVESIVAELQDSERSARYAAFRSNHHFLAGEQRRAIEFGEAGLRLVRNGADRRLEGELLYRIGQSYHLLGDNRRAIELLEQSINVTVEQRERYRFELSVIPAVVNRTWLVSVLAECGSFASGIAHAKRALEIAEEAQHPLSEVLGWLAIGHVLRRKGELNGAIQALERGMAMSDRYALRMWRLRLISSLGVAYAYCGRVPEGLQLAREALEGAERMGLIADQPMLHAHLGQALLLGGDIQAATDQAQRALQLALAHGDRGGEAWAGLLIGRAHLAAAGRALDEALMQLESALQVAQACEARPLAAFCQSALATIHARRGNKSKSEDYDASAAAVYKELDMRPLILEPLRQETLSAL